MEIETTVCEAAMFSIGKMSKKSGVSKRTLRFYETKGLISPEISPKNNYRYYRESDLGKIEEIQSLKSIGFSLDQISELLNAKPEVQTQESLKDILSRKYTQCIKEMEKLARQKKVMFSLLQQFANQRDIPLNSIFKTRAKGSIYHLPVKDELTVLEAVCTNDIKKVQKAINSGGDVNEIEIRGRTPLIIAAGNGYSEISKLLIQKKANLDICDDLGCCALMRAALCPSAQSMKYLIYNGAIIDNPDYWGTTPLIGAAYHNKVESVKLLLEAGADINFQDNKGRTAIDHAKRKTLKEMVELLEAHKA